MSLFLEGPPTEIELSRFNYFIDRKGDNDCWNWKGYKLKSGHGQIKYRGKVTYAYRLAYFIKDPSFNQCLCVLHKCDNGACVNPNHLFLGTMTDNMADCKKKGRVAVGTAVGGLLEEKDVLEIRQLYSTGKYSQGDLANRFKCHQSQISRIISGLRWGHIKEGIGMIPASS